MTQRAQSILRSGENFQWYVIPLLALVMYIYANEYSKKKKSGIDERIQRLSRFFTINHDYINGVRREYRTSKDDVVDALAALWSAERIFQNKHAILGDMGNAQGSKIYA